MTINRMFLAGILLTAFSASFAAESNKSVRDLYDELLKLQKRVGWTLEDLKKQQQGAEAIQAGNIQNILSHAQRTGLNKKFKDILTLDYTNTNDQLRGQREGSFPRIFSKYQNLRIIACLQQIYGQGQPFVYSNFNNPEKESDKISPAPGEMNPYYAVLGTYIAPGNQQRIITQYGFFNGLIDTIMHFENSGNPAFALTVSMIKDALIEAITVSRFYAYVYEIGSKIGLRTGIYPQDLTKEVIPAMKNLVPAAEWIWQNR